MDSSSRVETIVSQRNSHRKIVVSTRNSLVSRRNSLLSHRNRQVSPEKQRSFSQKPKKEPKLRINPTKKEPLEEERENSNDATSNGQAPPSELPNEAGSLSGDGEEQGSVDPELMNILAAWRGFDPDAGIPSRALGQLRQMAQKIETDEVGPTAAEYARGVSAGWFANHPYAQGKEASDASRYPSNYDQMEEWYLRCRGNPKLMETPGDDPYRLHIER